MGARSVTVGLALLVGLLAAVALIDALIAPAAQPVTSDRARARALEWTAGGRASAPRRDGDEWEVDVRRDNGSLVEVTLGPGLALRDLDEERGPRDSRAPNDLAGPQRARAIAAALSATGHAAGVRYVERDFDGAVEVGLLRTDGTATEVELHPRDFTVVEVEAESILDE